MAAGIEVIPKIMLLLGNEIREMSIQVLAAAPTPLAVGHTYFDSVLDALRTWDGAAWVNRASDALLLQGQNGAYYAARANHTGTQLAATVSDFDTQVRTNRLDQMAAPTADVSFNTRKITDLAAPTSANDAVRLTDLQATVAGLAPKDSVRVATSDPGTLATDFDNGSVVDDVTLATGDRILIRGQADPAENGIYVVAASGAPTRATDFDAEAEIRGALIPVEEGTVAGNTVFMVTTNAPIVVGTTGLSFTQFTAFTLPSNTVLQYTTTIGDGVATDFTITHGFTKNVTWSMYRTASPYDEIRPDVEHVTATQLKFYFINLLLTAGQFTVVVQGAAA